MKYGLYSLYCGLEVVNHIKVRQLRFVLSTVSKHGLYSLLPQRDTKYIHSPITVIQTLFHIKSYFRHFSLNYVP